MTPKNALPAALAAAVAEFERIKAARAARRQKAAPEARTAPKRPLALARPSKWPPAPGPERAGRPVPVGQAVRMWWNRDL